MTQQGPKFWDNIAEKYAARPIKDMDAYETTLERTRSCLHPDARVLEIGCGTGTTALHLADSAGDYLATDFSPALIGIGNQKLKGGTAKNVSFMEATPFDKRLESTSFDAVIAFNLLHLLEDAESAVSRVHELLKPGGVFVSKTTALGEAGPLLRIMISGMRFIGKAPYVRFFRTDELGSIIAAAGFEIAETGDYPAKPPGRFIVARKR